MGEKVLKQHIIMNQITNYCESWSDNKLFEDLKLSDLDFTFN